MKSKRVELTSKLLEWLYDFNRAIEQWNHPFLGIKSLRVTDYRALNIVLTAFLVAAEIYLLPGLALPFVLLLTWFFAQIVNDLPQNVFATLSRNKMLENYNRLFENSVKSRHLFSLLNIPLMLYFIAVCLLEPTPMHLLAGGILFVIRLLMMREYTKIIKNVGLKKFLVMSIPWPKTHVKVLKSCIKYQDNLESKFSACLVALNLMMVVILGGATFALATNLWLSMMSLAPMSGLLYTSVEYACLATRVTTIANLASTPTPHHMAYVSNDGKRAKMLPPGVQEEDWKLVDSFEGRPFVVQPL